MKQPFPRKPAKLRRRSEVMGLVAWTRFVAASVAAALSPLLPDDGARLRLAFFAGLVWLPWAWLGLLLVEKPDERWRRAASFAGDIGVVYAAQQIFPTGAGIQTAFIVVLAAHAVMLLESVARAYRHTSSMLAASEQSLGALLEQLPVALWTTDSDLVVTSWTGPGESLAGILAEAPLGARLDTLLGSFDPVLLQAHGHALSGEASDCDIARDTRTYQVYVRPLRDPTGVVTGTVGAALDITDRKLAEEAKTMFLATASHELKTPLTVIKGFAQTLLRFPDSLSKAAKVDALQAIVRRADELGNIVDRLLLSSRIESGRVDVDLERLPVGPIVRERAQSLEASIGRPVLLALDPSVPDVLADSAALATVVDHLLDNAVKYSPGGEPVRVSVRAEGDKVIIVVADSGAGMDKDQVQKCFERFWQADSTDGRYYQGTGIGLYIVRSLVEAMQGEVRAESAPGQGSSFIVSLQRADVRPPKRPLKRAGPGVGDSSAIRESMRQIGISTGGKA